MYGAYSLNRCGTNSCKLAIILFQIKEVQFTGDTVRFVQLSKSMLKALESKSTN